MSDAAKTRDLSALRIERGVPPRGIPRPPLWLVLVALVLGVAAVAWPVVKRLGLAAPEVAVAPVLRERPGAARGVLTASGHVTPRTKASVSVQRAGRLTYLGVEEGSHVVKGQVLARIESDDMEAEVAAARAELAQARAGLAVAQAEQARTLLDLREQRRLFAAGVGSRNARDRSEADADSSNAAVAEAAAAAQTAAARLAVVDEALADFEVLAPFTGVVLRKEAEVGESVAPAIASGQTTRGAIVTMADLSQLDVETDVSESNIGRVSEGMAAEIAIDAVTDRRYRGRVRQVLPTADRQKATVLVKVEILDADVRVKPEMAAKVSFLSEEPDPGVFQAQEVVTIPKAAVVTGDGGPWAWSVAGGRVSRTPLRLGATTGERVVVTEGLSGGELVVVSPPAGLEDGDAVKEKSR